MAGRQPVDRAGKIVDLVEGELQAVLAALAHAHDGQLVVGAADGLGDRHRAGDAHASPPAKKSAKPNGLLRLAWLAWPVVPSMVTPTLSPAAGLRRSRPRPAPACRTAAPGRDRSRPAATAAPAGWSRRSCPSWRCRKTSSASRGRGRRVAPPPATWSGTAGSGRRRSSSRRGRRRRASAGWC